MHPCSVSRKLKKYDRDGFVDRKRFGRTHVTFGEQAEYAKELGINGIVSGPDCRKRSGRTQAAFGEDTGFRKMMLKMARKEPETISLHTQSVWCNVFKGAEECPKRNVVISVVLKDFV